MNIADAWASETTTVTSAKRAERERLARETAEWLDAGNTIKCVDVVESKRTPAKWADFTISTREPKTGKRKSRGLK